MNQIDIPLKVTQSPQTRCDRDDIATVVQEIPQHKRQAVPTDT